MYNYSYFVIECCHQRDMLQGVIFPLGSLTKKQVRDIAIKGITNQNLQGIVDASYIFPSTSGSLLVTETNDYHSADSTDIDNVNVHDHVNHSVVNLQGLSVLTKPESMGICFIGKRSLPSFLSNYITLTPGRYII